MTITGFITYKTWIMENDMEKKYEYHLSGSAFEFAPIITYAAIVTCSEDEAIQIPECLPYKGGWGTGCHVEILEQSEHYLPQGIHIIYLSILEKEYYIINEELPQKDIESLWTSAAINKDSNQNQSINNSSLFENIVVGMAPYGNVAIWLNGISKSTLIFWKKGEKIDTSIFPQETTPASIRETCEFYINNDPLVKENLEKNGLPPRDLFDRYMQQFNYRYVVEFGHWDEENEEWKPYENDEVKPEFDYIEESLYDGTHDKLHDGGLMEYHQAGKPKKLALQWHIKKSEYSAFLWMDDMKIRAAFEAFYHDYPEAEIDFVFRIDPQKNKYQILFNCREAKQPIPLNEEAYQMIVFKSKFENYRSKNYNQPRGAWIW